MGKLGEKKTCKTNRGTYLDWGSVAVTSSCVIIHHGTSGHPLSSAELHLGYYIGRPGYPNKSTSALERDYFF